MLAKLVERQQALLEQLHQLLQQEQACLARQQTATLATIGKEKSVLLLQLLKMDNQIQKRPELNRPLIPAVQRAIDDAKNRLAQVKALNEQNKQMVDAHLASINRFAQALKNQGDISTLTYNDEGHPDTSSLVSRGFSV